MIIEIGTRSNFIVETVVPLITCIVLVVTAIGGVIKYLSVKNKERNEKIVNEVYLPFIEYLVKQELFRKIKCKDLSDYVESPILTITNRITSTNTNLETGTLNITSETVTPMANLNPKEIVEIKNKMNFGLAPESLIILLNMYEIIIEMFDKLKESDKDYDEICLVRIEVENMIRADMVKGFRKYQKKIAVKSQLNEKFYEFTEDQVIFKYKLDDLRKKYPNNKENDEDTKKHS